MRYVYILRCADATYYTGMTTDLVRRVEEHNHAAIGAKYTKCRRPVELVWNSAAMTRNEAAVEEYRIKKLRKEQKSALISAYDGF